MNRTQGVKVIGLLWVKRGGLLWVKTVVYYRVVTDIFCRDGPRECQKGQFVKGGGFVV